MKDTDFPSLKELLESGAHFGHVVRRWNPKMKPYIYIARNGVHIFDLIKTRDLLKIACEYLVEEVGKGKVVVFVGTKGQAVQVVKKEVERLGIPSVTNRWIGGTLTNWDQIKKRIDRLVDMRKKMEEGEYAKYIKKEQVMKRREIEQLDRLVGGLVDLKKKPDLLFVVDPNKEKTAVAEALALGIPVVAICDSNADPDMIEHIIPANDDALKSVELLVEAVAKAVEEGLKKVKVVKKEVKK